MSKDNNVFEIYSYDLQSSLTSLLAYVTTDGPQRIAWSEFQYDINNFNFNFN